MKRLGKKLTALLLAACLLLGLAACGEEKDDGAQQISGTIYVPTFTSITSEAEYIQQGCADSEYIYFTGMVQGEEHEETHTWTDENGVEQTESYTYYDYVTKLFQVPLAGGTAQELSGFEPTKLPEDSMEGSSDISKLRAGTDGSLWVTETLYTYTYDLPEDFDEETDSKYNYQTGEKNTIIVRKLDKTGAELDRIELENIQEKAGLDYVYDTIVDDAGNIYTNSDSKVAVLDREMNLLFSLDGKDMYGSMVILGDGTVGMRQSYYDEESKNGGTRLKVIDVAAKDWGASYELSQSAYDVYTGGGDFLFYYRNGTSVYGQKAGSGEGEKIFSWINSDIDQDQVQFFTFLADGRVAALTRNWDGEKVENEIAMLTPTDASTLPQKTTLTYACMGLGYDMRNTIIEFNKTSELYRIEVQDYNEYNTGEDNTAGLTKLNTEILAGRVPDILDAGTGMPIGQYGAKGLLEDLWPYIENDEEIGGRAGVMENALKAAEQNGKLYQIFDMFDIRTIVGAAGVVGDRTSWTLADLKAAMDTMPEGSTIFGESDTKESILDNILSCNIDSFVDWSTGTCSFNGDSFKALLEFCNSFPDEFNWEEVGEDYQNDEDRIVNGQQMLKLIYLDSFTIPQIQKGMFGGEVSFVGYPMEDGSVGSSFQPMGRFKFAMSSVSKNKDAVWSFIRKALLPQLEEEYWINDFPINRKDFERYMNDSMTIKYITDENGEQILDENGEPMKESRSSWWVDDDHQIEVYAATQEEVDQVMDIYNSVTAIWSYDNSIFDIVKENAGPYFAGDKTLDDAANLIQSAVKLYIGEQM